jgi:hypothetical protein
MCFSRMLHHLHRRPKLAATAHAKGILLPGEWVSPCFAKIRNNASSVLLHGQNDTKFCFSAHHAGVALGRFHERVLFNH